jgi:tRNA nucleotidyltransferase/poly(A) polymerase
MIDPALLPARIPEDVRDVCARLAAAGFEAFLVGGAVRDLLLDRPTQDFDVATSAKPAEVMKLFGQRFAVPTGLQHGTVTVVTPRGRNVEVTTYRADVGYADGRHPDQVAFVRTIEEDLARRDFTMNAIALAPATGELRDPWDGLGDLAARRIRAVGDPAARFGEDGLRPLRGVRFASQLGFELDPPTLAAIHPALPIFRKVSAERMRDELYKILGSEHPSIALRLMLETGLMDEVLPELVEGKGVLQNRFHRYDVLEHTLRTVDETPSRDPVVRLAALLHDVAKPRTAEPRADAPGEFTFFRHELVGSDLADAIARRLKLPNKDRERVCLLVGQHMFYYQPEWSEGTVLRFIRRVGLPNLPDLFALRVGDVRARGHGEDPEQEIGELRRRVDEAVAKQAALKISDLALSGQDVMAALGVAPGPLVGRVLRALLERVTDEPELNTREALLALLPEVARAAGDK